MSIPQKNLVKLSLTPDFNFVVFAIVSHINDYQLSWEINKILNIDLKRSKNFELIDSKSARIQSFSLFQFSDTDLHISYSLVTNKSENGFLLKEFGTIDFFLKVEGNVDNEYQRVLIEKLYSISDVSMATLVNHDWLKQKRLTEVLELFTEF